VKALPLFGSGINGKSPIVTAQRRLNCYAELRPDDDKAQIAFYGTPGLLLYKALSQTPDGSIRGMLASPNYLYVVAGSYLFKIHADGTADDVYTGTILTNSGPVSMAHNGTQILIVDGVAGYIFSAFDTPGGTLTVIADPDFPNGCKTCAFLSGFFIVENPSFNGRFQLSDSYNGSSWTGTQFATAEQDPDPLVAVDVDHGTLGLLGTKTIEYWQNVGALDFPFAPVIGATQEWGLAAQFSRAHVDNSVIFLAQNVQGQVQFMEFQGYQVVKISNNDIDAIINSFSTVTDAVAMSYLVDGHPMYQVTFPTANRSFLYDAQTQLWSEVQTGTALVNRHIGQYSVVFDNKIIVSDYSASNLYYFSSTTYTDNGATIKRQLQTRHVLRDFNVVGIDELYLNMETGVGIPTGQGSNPQIMLQVSRDDGRTFGPERWVSFGAGGRYRGPRAVWRRLGSGRDFVFKWTVTDPVKFAVTNGAVTLRERAQ